MRTPLLLCSVLLLLAPLSRAATEIRDLTERILLNNDGSAELSIAVLADLAPGEVLLLPFAHALPDSIRAEGDGFRAELRKDGDLQFLMIAGPWTPGRGERVQMHIPAFLPWHSLKRAAYGNATMQLAFTNTTPRRIQRYRGDMFLPAGYAVTSVVSSRPEQTEKDPVAPFEILEEDGRAGVSIRSTALGLGDGAFIEFRSKPADKSPILLIALALAGILYLVFYRDVLKENGNGPPAAQNAQS